MKKDHLEILLEDIQGKFDIVLEGYAALDRKFEKKFDELNEKIEFNSFKIDTLNTKIDGVAADLKATDKRLSAKIDAVAADLKDTDKRLSAKIDAVAADLKDTDKRLSAKIDAVAADLKATDKRLSAKIDGVAADLSAHRVDTELHHGVYQVKEGSRGYES